MSHCISSATLKLAPSLGIQGHFLVICLATFMLWLMGNPAVSIAGELKADGLNLVP
jgi:hypothetical protein